MVRSPSSLPFNPEHLWVLLRHAVDLQERWAGLGWAPRGRGRGRGGGTLCLEHRRTEVGRPGGDGVRPGSPAGVLGCLGS